MTASLVSILLPHREHRAGFGLAWRWCLHLGLASVLLAGLWYLNRWSDLGRWLHSPWPVLHRVWLPLVAVVLYAIAWLGIGLWSSLRRGSEICWPDIEAAWSAVRQALSIADIDVARTPMFVILGEPPREMEAALEALGAAALPHGAKAPFRIFVNAHAIYLVASRVSRLSHQDDRRDADASSRWRHLCELLLRDRAPGAPIQGVVLMVPFAATQTESAAQKAIRACADDLRDLREATGLDVPLHLAICDVAALPGASDADRHVGWAQHFPPQPDLDPAEIALMYEQGIEWLFTNDLCRAAEGRLRIDPIADRVEGIGSTLAENILVHQWTRDLLARRRGVTKILVEATRNDMMEPGLVTSCYLVPTALPADAAQELTRTLCADLLAQRETTAWTVESVARASMHRRLAWLGFGLGLAALIALAVTIGRFVAENVG